MKKGEVTQEQIGEDLIRYMDVLSRDIDGTKTTMKGFEVELTKAVEIDDEVGIQKYQQEIIKLIYNRMDTEEGAKAMTDAIFSDIRNLDPNWWGVNKLIANAITNTAWGYSWSSQDEEAFILFINEVIKDKKKEFTKLATKMRESEESADKNRKAFKSCIDGIQKKIKPKMSSKLEDTLIRKSSYPCSEAELETLFDQIVEPKTW